MQLLHLNSKSRYSWITAFYLAILLLVSGCASSQPIDPTYFEIPDKPLTREKFAVCHGYSCALHTPTSFSDPEWQDITSNLRPAAKSPVNERRNIARAIALMEQYSGEKTGTKTDVAKASFKMIDRKQQDCIDETINTDMYLKFLEKEGLLVWHSVDRPIRRGYFYDIKWPHNTATIKERETGNIYTVDSWFHKNGEEPWIVPAETWLSGESPEPKG